MNDSKDDLPAVHDAFDPGDDNKLQRAMLENLVRVHEEQLGRGEIQEAADTQMDIDALRAHMQEDHATDPHDTVRDDLDVR